MAYSRWQKAEDKIAQDGETTLTPNGFEVVSPWWSISNRAQESMLKFAREFGMTPSSRAGLKADGVAEETALEKHLREAKERREERRRP